MKALRVGAIISFLCTLYLYPSSGTAAAYRVRDADNAIPFVLFRDSDQPNAFYFLPTTFSIAASQGSQRIGIQIYSDPKIKSQVTASVTLSIAAVATSTQLTAAATAVRQKFGTTEPKLGPLSRVSTRMSVFGDATPITPLATGRWMTSPLDSSQSITFTVSNVSRRELLRLLSADAGGFSILVELQAEGIIAGAASARILTVQLNELSGRRGFVTPGPDFEKFVDETIDRAVEGTPTDKSLLRDSYSSWIRQRLGPPSLHRLKDKLLYGWALSANTFKPEDSSLRVLIGFPHSELFGSVIELGNLCRSNATAILNVDDGSSGCDSLR